MTTFSVHSASGASLGAANEPGSVDAAEAADPIGRSIVAAATANRPILDTAVYTMPRSQRRAKPTRIHSLDQAPADSLLYGARYTSTPSGKVAWQVEVNPDGAALVKSGTARRRRRAERRALRAIRRAHRRRS